MVSLVLPLALLAAALQLPPPAPPSPPRSSATRDNTERPRMGTAVIRGRVVEQDTGQPVARATISLSGSVAAQRSPRDGPVQTQTDVDGRYEFTLLPAGDYVIYVTAGELRATHLPQAYGESRPPQAGRFPRPQPIKLADGEIREDANVALWRAFAIEGRVVNEFGEPMAGVYLQVRAASTGRQVGMSGPYSFSSDDRGAYRVYGLAPGSYTVCASTRGGVPSSEGLEERYVETCHPSALTEANAQPVTVISGDIAGVDIRLQRSRTYTVSGTALDSKGAPLQRGQVSLMRIDRYGSSGSGLEVRPDGRFVARGLAPGEYAIQADTWRRSGPMDVPDPDREVALLPFRIDGFDIDGLVVATSRVATVAGRLVFEDAAPPNRTSGMQVLASPERSRARVGIMGPPPRAQVQDDLTFQLSGLSGPTLITVSGAPENWIVKSVRYRGEDITDVPADFTGGREGDRLEIVLTNRGARVSGTVTDDRGNPFNEGLVVLLPADRARWAFQFGLRMTAGPQNDAGFKLGPVRAGEYLIVAVDRDDGPSGPPDEKYFARVAAVADRITLVEGEEQVLQLRLRRLQ